MQHTSQTYESVYIFLSFVCLVLFDSCLVFCVVWIRLACPCPPTLLPTQGLSTCLCPSRFLVCPAVLHHSTHNSSQSSSILRPERNPEHSMMATTLLVSQNGDRNAFQNNVKDLM